MELTQDMIDFCESQKWDPDVRQDVYKRVLLSPEKEVHNGWLTTVYNNLYKDSLRADLLHGALEEEFRDMIIRQLGHDNGEGADPLDILMGTEDMHNKLKLLSPLLLQTLIRVFLDGMPVAELAAWEGVEVNVIYQRIHQAKKILEGAENE